MDRPAPPPNAAAPAAPVEARVGQILDWLAHPAGSDAERELREVHGRLAAFSELPLSINQFHRILDLFQSRVDPIAAVVKRRLRGHEQPLPRELAQLAQNLDDLEERIWDGYSRILKDIEHRLVRNRRRDPAAVAARALKALRERLEIAAYLSRPAPPELWSRAHWLHGGCKPGAGHGEAAGAANAGRLYREMLAFAAIQPERLSPPEVGGAADYLTRFAPAVVILDQPPETTDYRLFWADPTADAAPMALARRPPAAGQEALYFSCVRLGTLAAEHLRELEAGTAPQQLGLPPEAGRSPFRGLMHLLCEAWGEPPTRHLLRRRQNYQVSLVAGLQALVGLFDASAGERPEPSPSTWTVTNESPSGYALLHAQGDAGTVKTGEVVAIRSGDDQPWDVCIVRRVRSEPGGRMEMGLQIIAARSSARAVKLAFRHAATPHEAIPALWLPAVAALRRHNAVLVPSGVASSQRFVMAEQDERLRITQGRVVETSLRTPSVDLLEFQDDPYPL
jgi:hypothetical protein